MSTRRWLGQNYDIALAAFALAVVLLLLFLWQIGFIGGRPRPNWSEVVEPGARWCFVMDGKPVVCRAIEADDISITAEDPRAKKPR